ncbi:single-stranded nucleic acid binding R3H domain protein [Desulfonatronospira thiodismutans ASO3-1]|uniref:RNA-binding protein KhpB n=1 Tax=Desulfonatronospira thiodismutans ASO3-1 TaxID=555779 RepID=D6SNH4_9BACT|nr:RNA-binding cell elongation regulator Jag/EloR [Desulfonatronospira thiodismutans]EFI34300.1 single-stranded nucleic acid binding R3H domain protein [Desulfonatronospira thiodismutans ASO3-1]
MDNYIEFSGKNVDEAIQSACKYFHINRDQLEVEIVSGGSSGIFGLVGVKKATIKAKRRPRKQEQEQKEEASAAAQQEEPLISAQEESEEDSPVGPIFEDDPEGDMEEDMEDQESDALKPPPARFLQELIQRLTTPLAPEVDIKIREDTSPITVVVQDTHNSGILLGRDGQTLSALQYITNRIIAKKYPGTARIQLDTENFLEKQTEKLEKNAQQLAQRAIKAGKTMSTRPLSSYHRRIVHLALQGENKIRTKSKGDGPMKRVLIMPKSSGRRKNKSQQQQQEQQQN